MRTVNTVVSLLEQKRMEHDVEYGEAVKHLQICQCNLDDVDLFNSHVIKSSENTDGVYLVITWLLQLLKQIQLGK